MQILAFYKTTIGWGVAQLAFPANAIANKVLQPMSMRNQNIRLCFHNFWHFEKEMLNSKQQFQKMVWDTLATIYHHLICDLDYDIVK